MVRKLNSFIVRIILKLIRVKDNYIIFESADHHVFDNSFYLFKFLKKYRKLRLFYVVYNRNQYLEAISKGIKKRQVFLISERINIHMKAYGGGEEIFGPVSITYNPDVEKYVAMVTCYSREPIKTYLGGDLDMDSIQRSF